MHKYTEFLAAKAKAKHGRVAVPDAACEGRYLEAVVRVHEMDMLDLVITGSRKQTQALAEKHGLDISGIEIIDPDESQDLDAYSGLYGKLRAKENLTASQIRELMHHPVYFACMLLKHGLVDGICSGVYYSTAELARPCIKILGMQPGIKKMTALGVIAFEHCALGDDLVYCVADSTILPDPTAEELAEIAILSAEKSKEILPDVPRVAMLSFSTCGSASHPMVDKVVKALKIANEQRPDLLIDGEFQLDTAIVPYVAEKKMKRPSEVAGRANVLIWPDLQSGNIASKGMFLMGGGLSVGATFMGINGLVNDHSRGATVDEVITNIAFMGAQL